MRCLELLKLEHAHRNPGCLGSRWRHANGILWLKSRILSSRTSSTVPRSSLGRRMWNWRGHGGARREQTARCLPWRMLHVVTVVTCCFSWFYCSTIRAPWNASTCSLKNMNSFLWKASWGVQIEKRNAEFFRSCACVRPPIRWARNRKARNTHGSTEAFLAAWWLHATV